ncbi:hypothetical protein WJX84_006358 [Apatococcus fuscideae]|uniref:AB hydrolase-1 domain-containing protein n=1 Tax=Apatococcus fuscideae TaxID=2026836 RepID=A0AAW1T252_9CHLO
MAAYLLSARLAGSVAEAFPVILLAAALSRLSSGTAWWQSALAVWGWLELLFYSVQLVRYHHLNAVKKVVPDLAHIEKIRHRFMSLKGIFNLKDFVSGWFFGRPWDELRLSNLHSFAAYSLFSAEMSDLQPQEQQIVTGFVDEALVVWGESIGPGETKAPHMTHMWEPLRVLPKPLLIHAASESTACIYRLALWAQGFQHLRHKDLSYWIRWPPTQAASSSGPAPQSSADGSGMPVVFLHGVGFGMVPYWGFISMLTKQENLRRPVVLLDLPHVSMRLWPRAMDIDDAAHAVAGILAIHQWPTSCIVAHSFGTFVASRLCQLHPACVQATVLIDPVCLMTCFPDLLHNFVYLQPKWSSLFSHAGCMDVLRFFCSRDLLIAETFCRRFIWHAVMLWPQELPASSLVVMSAKDNLVPWRIAQQQLVQARHPAQILVHPDMAHGGFLLNHAWQQQILDTLRPMLDGI